MLSITIPKEVTHGEELVVIPRRLYEELLHVFKSTSSSSTHFNKRLREALEDVHKGRLVGPFSSLEEGLRVLKKS